MPDLTIKAGDTYPAFVAVLEEITGPIDLTGADGVTMRMASDTVTLPSLTCTVVDAAQGIVSRVFTSGNTATPGLYSVEFEIEWDAGEIQTVPNDGVKEILIVDSVPVAP
jgi:hypothetical protein